MKRTLLLNSIQCNNCRDILISKHRHDFVSCSCIGHKRISLDGGLDYIKLTYGSQGSYRNICIYSENIADISKYLCWGVNYTKDMKRLPQTEWRPINTLDTEHIEAILSTQRHLAPLYKKAFLYELWYRKTDINE